MQKPNYIHTLEGKVRDAHHLAEDAISQLNELIAYLESPKFWTDTTVQKNDVLRRIQPVRSRLLDISDVSRTKTQTRTHHFADY
jgi:hypothetical protein